MSRPSNFPLIYQKSAVALEIGLILFGTIALQRMSSGLDWLALPLTFLVATPLLVHPARYEIANGEIKFRSGFATIGKARLSEVTSVSRGRGWPASHTLSPLEGIALTKQQGRMFVIARDEAGFLTALAAEAPHLKPSIDALQSTRG